MKIFAVVFAVCLASVYAGLTDEQKAKLDEYRTACIAETGVDNAVVEKIKAGEQVEFEEKVNCYVACMMKKVGVMKEDGTFDEEVARAKVPEDVPKEKSDAVITKCSAEVVPGNSCESGGKVLKCLMETDAVSFLH